MTITTEDILGTIADAACKRDDVADDYSLALRESRDIIDWPKVNAAVINRWSLSALKYIKGMAWAGLEWDGTKR